MLIVFPTVEQATDFARNKLNQTILNSPVLKSLVYEDTSPYKKKRGLGESQVCSKRFPNGNLTLHGATSAIRSLTCKHIWFDEVSAYNSTTLKDEGDPLAVANRRSATFDDSFFFESSTPTISGSCRISLDFEASDQRRWFVPCHYCGSEFHLRWEHVKWTKDTGADGKIIHHSETAHIECEACGSAWTEEQRKTAVGNGRWIATKPNPSSSSLAGFHLNGLVCTLKPKRGFVSKLHEFADEFLRATKRGTQFLRSFQNSVLAEPFTIEEGPAIPHTELYSRREVYADYNSEIIIPDGVVLLACGVDVQRDRLELSIIGFGMDNETYGIQYKVIQGNPELPAVWQELDQITRKKFRHSSGHLMWCAAVAVDSGYLADAVYKAVKSFAPVDGRMTIAVKGMRGWMALGQNWVNRSASDNHLLWTMKTDSLKDSLYNRARITDVGPGYIHIPANPQCGYDEEWCRGLLCEVLKTSSTGVKYYGKSSSESRNEPLDTFLLATAGCESLKPDYAACAEFLSSPPPNDWMADAVEINLSKPTSEPSDLNDALAHLDRVLEKINLK
jgi:phage terminase large subunit GpA-like protein